MAAKTNLHDLSATPKPVLDRQGNVHLVIVADCYTDNDQRLRKELQSLPMIKGGWARLASV